MPETTPGPAVPADWLDPALSMPDLLGRVRSSAVELLGASSASVALTGPGGIELHAGERVDTAPADDPVVDVSLPVRATDFTDLRVVARTLRRVGATEQRSMADLAAMAARAVELQLLAQEALQRREWASIATQLLPALVDRSIDDTRVLDSVRSLLGAESAVLLAPGAPAEAERAVGSLPTPAAGMPRILAARDGVLESRAPLLGTAPGLQDPDAPGPVLAVPLMAAGRVDRVLVATRAADADPFTIAVLGMAADFAAEWSVARQAVGRGSAASAVD